MKWHEMAPSSFKWYPLLGLSTLSDLKDVLDEVAEARGHFDLAAVWSALAPAGNVYRLNGLQQASDLEILL